MREFKNLSDEQKERQKICHAEFRLRSKIGEATERVPRGLKLTEEEHENYVLWLELGIHPKKGQI